MTWKYATQAFIYCMHRHMESGVHRRRRDARVACSVVVVAIGNIRPVDVYL